MSKNAIEKAEQTLAKLESKCAECVRQGTELADERAAVALDAHTGNDKARKRLNEINSAISTHTSELASFDAAIKAAQQKLADAQDSQRRAEEALTAGELKELAQIMSAAGVRADKALKQLIEASNDIKKCIQATSQRGLANPTAQQLQSLGRRAILGAIVGSPFKTEFEHVAPNQRANFREFTAAWESMILKAVTSKLGSGNKSAA